MSSSSKSEPDVVDRMVTARLAVVAAAALDESDADTALGMVDDIVVGLSAIADPATVRVFLEALLDFAASHGFDGTTTLVSAMLAVAKVRADE